MLDYADLIALNKSDKRGALDAIQAVKNSFSVTTNCGKTIRRNASFSTKASQFNDWGTTALYNALIEKK